VLTGADGNAEQYPWLLTGAPRRKRGVAAQKTLMFEKAQAPSDSLFTLSPMRKLFQALAFSALLFGPASAAHAQVSFGVRIGPPPEPRWYRIPPQPGPDREWIEGYWYPDGGRYRWHDGYWTRPPYAGAYWVAPYHVGGQYFAGRWEGPRGYVMHDHRWDRGGRRDERREPREERGRSR
jgi:hypothetical protein